MLSCYSDVMHLYVLQLRRLRAGCVLLLQGFCMPAVLSDMVASALALGWLCAHLCEGQPQQPPAQQGFAQARQQAARITLCSCMRALTASRLRQGPVKAAYAVSKAVMKLVECTTWLCRSARLLAVSEC